MIHYRLRCTCAHEFEGWFPDSASFEHQQATGLLSCPACGGTGVERALMAPAIARMRQAVVRQGPEPEPRADTPPAPMSGSVSASKPASGPSSGPGSPVALPDQAVALLRRLRHEVERRAEYVGPGLAREARRIHEGDSAPREIYGEATRDQVEALEDDGIRLIAIPWLPRLDS